MRAPLRADRTESASLSGRNPRHYTVGFYDLERGVKALASCACEVVTNPYHDG